MKKLLIIKKITDSTFILFLNEQCKEIEFSATVTNYNSISSFINNHIIWNNKWSIIIQLCII
jgi:hypothetical protein